MTKENQKKKPIKQNKEKKKTSIFKRILFTFLSLIVRKFTKKNTRFGGCGIIYSGK